MHKHSLIKGFEYVLTTEEEGHKPGTVVVFNGLTENGNWAICNEVGEPDMQSSFCVDPKNLEE
jgi:hypothetical protein